MSMLRGYTSYFLLIVTVISLYGKALSGGVQLSQDEDGRQGSRFGQNLDLVPGSALQREIGQLGNLDSQSTQKGGARSGQSRDQGLQKPSPYGQSVSPWSRQQNPLGTKDIFQNQPGTSTKGGQAPVQQPLRVQQFATRPEGFRSWRSDVNPENKEIGGKIQQTDLQTNNFVAPSPQYRQPLIQDYEQSGLGEGSDIGPGLNGDQGRASELEGGRKNFDKGRVQGPAQSNRDSNLERLIQRPRRPLLQNFANSRSASFKEFQPRQNSIGVTNDEGSDIGAGWGQGTELKEVKSRGPNQNQQPLSPRYEQPGQAGSISDQRDILEVEKVKPWGNSGRQINQGRNGIPDQVNPKSKSFDSRVRPSYNENNGQSASLQNEGTQGDKGILPDGISREQDTFQGRPQIQPQRPYPPNNLQEKSKALEQPLELPFTPRFNRFQELQGSQTRQPQGPSSQSTQQDRSKGLGNSQQRDSFRQRLNGQGLQRPQKGQSQRSSLQNIQQGRPKDFGDLQQRGPNTPRVNEIQDFQGQLGRQSGRPPLRNNQQESKGFENPQQRRPLLQQPFGSQNNLRPFEFGQGSPDNSQNRFLQQPRFNGILPFSQGNQGNTFPMSFEAREKMTINALNTGMVPQQLKAFIRSSCQNMRDNGIFTGLTRIRWQDCCRVFLSDRDNMEMAMDIVMANGGD